MSLDERPTADEPSLDERPKARRPRRVMGRKARQDHGDEEATQLRADCAHAMDERLW